MRDQRIKKRRLASLLPTTSKNKNSLSIDKLSQRCAVYVDEQMSSFWLVEELPTGVCVSQRDTASLSEIAAPIWLEAYQLLEAKGESRPLNGFQVQGIFPYHEQLLLLLVNE